MDQLTLRHPPLILHTPFGEGKGLSRYPIPSLTGSSLLKLTENLVKALTLS